MSKTQDHSNTFIKKIIYDTRIIHNIMKVGDDKMDKMEFHWDLKYLILGYRKHTGNTQRELAQKLGVPLEIETAIEMGTYKYPTGRLMTKINDLTEEFDETELIQIGRGYWIKDKLGSYFKYFVLGLQSKEDMEPEELNDLSGDDFYKRIGSKNLNEYEFVNAGMNI
jgi:transcriptional regulator with XRE-family HTH domain